jgi:pimeloyl-ACP methyl ester carboxylesterase
MTSGNDGVYLISSTAEEDRIADIVFVHGLGGSSHDTWRYGLEGSSDGFFWPEELAKDLRNCGIWTAGYPAGFTRLGQPGMIIEKRAGNLAHKLANVGIGSRPLVFICHSMGGLVIKALVTESQTSPDEDRRQITSMVRGIIFCATPHRGSAFADAAGVLGQLLLGTQAHVDEMKANAEPLDLLHDRFIEWHRRTQIPIESYAENIGLFRTGLLGRPLPLGLVVPRASANTGIAGTSVRDVDAVLRTAGGREPGLSSAHESLSCIGSRPPR